MATQTTHYSLVKPAYEDQADVGVLNGDLDQIDELIYDASNDVRPVSKGGTGASTVSGAKTNLGISALENALGQVNFVHKTIPAKVSTTVPGRVTYTFSGSCAFFVFTSGTSGQGTRSIIGGYCSASGLITATKLDLASSNGIGTEIENGTLTLTNNASNAVQALLIAYFGTAPQ